MTRNSTRDLPIGKRKFDQPNNNKLISRFCVFAGMIVCRYKKIGRNGEKIRGKISVQNTIEMTSNFKLGRPVP